MKDIFLARQPIFDVDLNVHAYELLYRESDVNAVVIENPDKATAEVLLNTFSDFGLSKVTNNKPAFVNLGKNFLTEKSIHLFPQDKITLQIEEDVTDDQTLIPVLAKLRSKGYAIVLKAGNYTKNWQLLVKMADIVRIDVLNASLINVKKQIEMATLYKTQVLAEKIESYELLNACKKLGFSYFQGYFLCRPKMVTGKGLLTSKATVLELLSKLQSPDTDADELCKTLSTDAKLSFKILRMINSAAYNMQRKISSLKEAVVFLGMDEK